MTTIDDKVVAMSFESSKFESGVNKAIASLDKLKASLKFPEAGKGLDDINAAAKRVDLSHISKGIDVIKGSLNALRLIGISVLANLATAAVRSGARFLEAFTLDPIKAGFSEYATNLNAVQTILANTQASGAKLKDVNAALLDLNKYSDKTIYNFSQMAKNIGTFTAAGVDLDTSTQAIKGIANLAALSGSNAEQASTAMYQLSQAISAGRVSLQDWNSVVNAGMGGTVFQRALAQTAEAMGTLKEGTVKLTGPMKNVSISGESFRQSLQAGPGKTSWLTSDVLTNTLKQFTSDMTDAQLAAMGFNDTQIAAIQQTAKTAMHAATEVKTLTQVLDVAKETAGSGWAQTWQIIFGDFGEAKTTFTALSNSINGFINSMSKARNKVLADWKALGGRTILIEGIKTAFDNLGRILKPIKDAFRDIFPAKTGRDLLTLTKRFRDFADAIRPSQETIDNLRRTFRGVFAVLDIGKQVIAGVITMFRKMFSAAGAGSGGFLSFTGNVGDFLVELDKTLKKGAKVNDFFSQLGGYLAVPLKLLGKLKDALFNLFFGFRTTKVVTQMVGLTNAMTPFQKVVETISSVWDKLVTSLTSGPSLQPTIDSIVKSIEQIGAAIGKAVSTINFEPILSVIRTGLFAGLVVMFKQFLGKGSLMTQLGGAGGGILGNISKSFDALRGSMVAMQQNIKAKTLKEIAIAVGLLTISMVALSFIDPKKLGASLAAMTIAFGQLLGAMALLTAVTRSAGFIKLPIITASLILLAGAIDLLTIAVVALSKLSWQQLIKGLSATAALLGIIAVAAVPLSANSAGMIRAGLGITAIAIGLRILANAVAAFGAMNWSTIGKGLVSVAFGLGILTASMRSMPTTGMIAMGAGLIAAAIGLRLLAGVVEKFGGMDWKTIFKGMVSIAAALLIIAGAMEVMPPNMPILAAGLVLVSFALKGIAKAIMLMGGMSWIQIAKGLVALAGALTLLAAAMIVMQEAAGGAIALAIAAQGVGILARALTALGKQSWGQILKSLVVLAAALTILGAAGVLLTPAIPTLLGLGAALILIGGGLALAGAGIALIGVGLSAIAVAGPTAIGILISALTELMNAVPEAAKNLILGLLEIVRALAATAPKFVEAIMKIIGDLLGGIVKAAPKIAAAFAALVVAGVKALGDNQGRIIQAGLGFLEALLSGIRDNIGRVTDTVIGIVVNFLGAIANNIRKIAAAGVDILFALIQGIASGYARVFNTAINIILRFISGIAGSLGKIATAGLSVLTKFLAAIADNLGKVVTQGTNVIVKFVTGMANAGSRIVTAAGIAMGKFINAMVTASLRLINVGALAIIRFLNGVADAIDKYEPQMIAAGFRIGVAIVQGMINGLGSMAGQLVGKAENLAQSAISGALHKLSIRSPSAVFYDIGQNIVLGLAKGMSDNKTSVDAAVAMGSKVIGAVEDIFQIASPSKVMYEIGQFVGQGFAQGIRGSTDDIRNAFADLNSKLTDAMRTARETIITELSRLNKLRAAEKPDQQAIRETQAIITQNEAVLRRAGAAHAALVLSLRGEKRELIGLTNEYQRVGDRLKAANDVLAQAKQTRDDAIKSFADQYSTLPSIVTTDAEGHAVDQLATYMAALKNQADAVAAYQSTLDQLRKLGLDDATYQKLLTEGPADQAFATQLLAGGKTAIQGLNTLDTNLKKVSKSLAVQAAKNLYQAGVDAAQGLVNGLKSKQSAIRKTMEAIAEEMLRALRKKLEITSPSEAFAEIGRYSMEGMAKGFSDSSKMVTNAVDSAATNALSAMKKSMQDISDVVTDELNPSPVITPILDLTQVRGQTEELAALTKVTPITAAASFGQAAMISSAQSANQAEQTAVAPGGTSVKFEQNNYSPESLSEVEIYRQTKNQLSQLKSLGAVT